VHGLKENMVRLPCQVARAHTDGIVQSTYIFTRYFSSYQRRASLYARIVRPEKYV
jgi:hypothetical protein